MTRAPGRGAYVPLLLFLVLAVGACDRGDEIEDRLADLAEREQQIVEKIAALHDRQQQVAEKLKLNEERLVEVRRKRAQLEKLRAARTPVVIRPGSE